MRGVLAGSSRAQRDTESFGHSLCIACDPKVGRTRFVGKRCYRSSCSLVSPYKTGDSWREQQNPASHSIRHNLPRVRRELPLITLSVEKRLNHSSRQTHEDNES